MSTPSETIPSVLIIAAEASSSLYAQRLLEKWKKDGRKVDAFGIGSRSMEKLGFECIGRSEEMAVVGVQEVFAHLPKILDVANRLTEAAKKRRPKFVLLLDYPDFNFRFAKRMKKIGIPVIYYISPQIWAWRTGRIKLVQKYMDRMLVLFPFEKDFYQKFGVSVDFVGHPLLDEIDPKLFDSSWRTERRQRLGLSEDDVVFALMPGSRRSEIKHHLATQLATAKLVLEKAPTTRVLLLVAPTLERNQLRPYLDDIDFPIQMVQETPFEMISLADAILVASGTATLMVGLMAKPMVIMYRMNAFTAFLAKKLVKKTRFFGMANLIMEREAVPELFQEDATPIRLASEILSLLQSEEKREAVSKDLKGLSEKLGARGATENVAKILEGYFNK